MPSGSNSGSLGILVRGRSKSAKEFKVVPVGGRTVHAPVEIVYAMHDFEDVSRRRVMLIFPFFILIPMFY